MRFQEEIKKLSPTDPIRIRLTSPEYKLSDKILGLRIKHNLTRKQASRRCQMTLKEYTDYEHGTVTGHFGKYKKIIKQLNSQLLFIFDKKEPAF